MKDQVIITMNEAMLKELEMWLKNDSLTEYRILHKGFPMVIFQKGAKDGEWNISQSDR